MRPAPGTDFAPAARLERGDLLRQVGYFRESQFSRHLLDAVPAILTILNAYRQVVYVNSALLDLLGVDDPEALYGLRPGEALDCAVSQTAPGGCGTGEACSTCGAVLAILAGLAGTASCRECRVTRCVGGDLQPLELRVWATPLRYREEDFTIFAVNDISHEKRRQALERVFFHDILNLMGSIKGSAELLERYPGMQQEDLFALIQGAAEQVIDEVEAQRTLATAEAGGLAVAADTLSSRLLLEQLCALYRAHDVAAERTLAVAAESEDQIFVSDRGLLARVLGNMLKNALEAIPPGEQVTLGCRRDGDRIEFWVHNPGGIPRPSQLQIFQRSFSTKGKGRGLGTYGMRLLSDYLEGEVGFTSSAEAGTVFWGRYPLRRDFSGT
jgi:signal transduction histidine kinase